MFLSTFNELGEYHFFIVKEHFVIEQITFEQNALSPQNWKGSAEHKMHVCVGWYIIRNYL
jgi:hypothetical protein